MEIDIAYLGRYAMTPRSEILAMTIPDFRRALAAISIWVMRENGKEE